MRPVSGERVRVEREPGGRETEREGRRGRTWTSSALVPLTSPSTWTTKPCCSCCAIASVFWRWSSRSLRCRAASARSLRAAISAWRSCCAAFWPLMPIARVLTAPSCGPEAGACRMGCAAGVAVPKGRSEADVVVSTPARARRAAVLIEGRYRSLFSPKRSCCHLPSAALAAAGAGRCLSPASRGRGGGGGTHESAQVRIARAIEGDKGGGTHRVGRRPTACAVGALRSWATGAAAPGRAGRAAALWREVERARGHRS